MFRLRTAFYQQCALPWCIGLDQFQYLPSMLAIVFIIASYMVRERYTLYSCPYMVGVKHYGIRFLYKPLHTEPIVGIVEVNQIGNNTQTGTV